MVFTLVTVLAGAVIVTVEADLTGALLLDAVTVETEVIVTVEAAVVLPPGTDEVTVTVLRPPLFTVRQLVTVPDPLPLIVCVE